MNAGLRGIVAIGLLGPAALGSAALGAAGAQQRFTAPFQPDTYGDGHVHLTRPATLYPTFDAQPLNTLMVAGWRLVWNEGEPGPGELVVRFSLRVVPTPPEKTATEVLQVGASRDPNVVATCTSFGIGGGSGRMLPARTIGGTTFAAAENGDAGMSQQIAGLALRAVVGGTCYAVDRFAAGESASDGDAGVTLPQAKGAAILDAMLASLRLTP